jgi:hypothetical protein
VNLDLSIGAGPTRTQVTVDLAPMQALWARMQAGASAHRAADLGAPRPGVQRARCGCPCGAGAERILTEGTIRACTGCGMVQDL